MPRIPLDLMRLSCAKADSLLASAFLCCFIGGAPPTLLAQGVPAKTMAPAAEPQRVLRVGPTRRIKTIAEAAKLVVDGDTVEIDAGDYTADVAVWSRDRLTLRSVGGVARLLAAGAAAEGKGIWVVRGRDILVEGFEFRGARVADRNGAGIRLESGSLRVRECRFTDNENGILTSNNPSLVLQIENSEFGHNGAGDGLSHNLYVGAIAQLSVTGSYFHHAQQGHLLKSRAMVNLIRYNRLSDGADGRASYELEFPNGGLALVVGNTIQQGPLTENPHLISYGAEGYKWPQNGLYLINNTLIDKLRQGGVFLRVKPGDAKVRAINNLTLGPAKLAAGLNGDFRNNFTAFPADFASPADEDYRLRRNSTIRDLAVDPGGADGLTLLPDSEYLHPAKTNRLTDRPRQVGALQGLF